MNKEMDRFGVGPKFTVLGLGYGIVTFLLHYLFFPDFTFTLISRGVNILFGIILILIGIPLFIVSGKMVHGHINEGKLCTTGVYAYFRHPLYAAWVVLIVPGVVVLTGSVIAISLPVFLYILFKIFTVEEEEYLKEKFGNEYLRYEKEVNSIFPKLWEKYKPLQT